MLGNINQRQMKQAMKRMGIKQKEIEAERVIIELSDSRIIIENPSVMKVKMMGQDNYQISGQERVEEIDSAPEITEEDIKTVMDSASCSEEEAKKALEENDGDLAKSIMSLKEE
jgi:nascent polypeptide-associated complex subunit alpha